MMAVLRIACVFKKPTSLKFLFQNSSCKFLNNKFSFCSEKLNDVPAPPKRPLTAYMLFCKENRKSLVKDNPSLTGPQQIKILAEKWTNLGPSLKKVYEDTAREEIISYGEAHKEFYESLTETQRELLIKLKADKKESRKALKLKKALRESGLPKHPNSAYTIFVQDMAKENKPVISLSEFSKEVASLWRAMSEEQKQPYVTKANLVKEEYESRMIKWRETMITNGQDNLIAAYDEQKTKGRKISKDTEHKSSDKL